MNQKQLFESIKQKQSFLCIGLDTEVKQIPQHLLEFEDPIFEFNKQIVDATHDLSIAFKPNTAFYESQGSKGWLSLEKTADYIKTNYPDILLIADAKRGDIGNTSKMYAQAFFESMKFDAITVSPYMGSDSIKPFLEYPDKFVIILILTSNTGAWDFQFSFDCEEEMYLFEKVLIEAKKWGSMENIMFVAGATKASLISTIRKHAPENFLLVPGIGAQGGSVEDVVKHGITKQCGLIINSSRAIIFADSTTNFALTAREKAIAIQKEMKHYLEIYNLI